MTLTIPVKRTDQPWSLTALLLIATTAFTFFIVEHSLTMSTISESIESTEFVEAEVDSDVEEGSKLRRVAFLAFGAVGGLLVVTERRPLPIHHIAGYAGIGFILWIFASITWSVDTGLTIRRLVVITLCVVGLAGWSRTLQPRQSVLALLAIAGGYLALGLVCEVGLRTFRPWSGEHRFGGTTHPNTQGILCGMLLIGAAVRLAEPTRRLRWLGIAAVALVFLYLTKSRTTLGASLIAVAALFWLRAGWAVRLGTVLIAVLTTSGALLATVIFAPKSAGSLTDALLMGRTEEVTTLTGRLPLWEELIGDLAARPLHGYGYGAFWNPGTIFRVAQNQGWQIPHAHSGYFETALNLGLIGLLLAMTAVLACMVSAWNRDRQFPRLETGFPIGLGLFAAVYSLADAGFALPTFAAFALAATIFQTAGLAASRDRQPMPRVVTTQPRRRESCAATPAMT